jgi:hypothetical protein
MHKKTTEVRIDDMNGQTELHPDDGTDISPYTLVCSCTGSTSYLVRQSKEVLLLEPVGLTEYTFVCPSCSRAVVMRVPHAETK